MATKKATARTPASPAIQRGLATYLANPDEDPDGRMTVLLPLAKIKGQITVKQARKQGKDLQAFCESIRAEGLLQPIVVREVEGGYELVAGRHRTLAHKLLGLDDIPAIVRKDMSESSGHVAAAIENLQRADIDTWEEACVYAAALKDPKVTRKALAERIGVAASTITQRMKLHALGPKYGPWAATLRQEDLEILAAFHEHPKLMEAACKAAKNNAYGWNISDRVATAFVDRDDVCLPNDSRFIQKHAAINGWDEIHRVSTNPTYRKELKALPRLKVGGGHRVREFCLDPKAARAACKAAGERMRAGQKASASRAVGKPGVDVGKRAQNRAVKAQDEAMVKHLKGIVSFGPDWHQMFLKRWLKSEGLIASTKQKRAAFAELTGITSWDGRAEALIPHIEKAGWDSPEAGRILAGALHLTGSSWQPYVPDPGAQITTGKTWKGLLDKATRDVKAELKAAEARKKAKSAKKTATAKKEKAKPADAPRKTPVKKRAKKAAAAAKAAKATNGQADEKPVVPAKGTKAAKTVHAIHTGQHTPTGRPHAAPGKECPECGTIVKAFQKDKQARVKCICTPEEGVLAA